MKYKYEQVIDHVYTGREAKRFRVECGLSLREVARRMGLSATYVSHLERGLRNWTQIKLEKYNAAVMNREESK